MFQVWHDDLWLDMHEEKQQLRKCKDIVYVRGKQARDGKQTKAKDDSNDTMRYRNIRADTGLVRERG